MMGKELQNTVELPSTSERQSKDWGKKCDKCSIGSRETQSSHPDGILAVLENISLTV